MLDEFDLIAAYFAPLAQSPGALGLSDDVAVLQTRGDVVVTADALVEGVHFLPDDPLATVARKLFRVNASDLIAKGALPIGVLLTLMWPRGRPTEQIAQFAAGLAAEQQNGFALLGGDTVSTPGPFSVSLTMIGRPLGARGPVLRSGAQPGDVVAVTGVIGDGYLGLQARLEQLDDIPAEDRAALSLIYQVPLPPFGAEAAIARHATAALDVSDGLIADAGHLARRSGVRLEIMANAVPLSAQARGWLEKAADRSLALGALLTGGDDYQTLFAAPANAIEQMRAEAPRVPITVIGQCMAGQGVAVVNADNIEMTLPKPGWRHF
ncbi:thiamine-phosphate kinase [Aphanothece microscopica]|uniref:thiamine-phosphate kinase n=1 Tax=Aphanothece microscopica TaxID=1049561 RepID=UPI003CE594C6